MESTSGDEREIRAARNQSMFRQINERLTRDDPLAELTGSHVIACECADATCVQTLSISHEQYQRIRSQPRHFAVLHGHVYPEVEIVVAEHRTHVVVEKAGEAAHIAEALDPTAVTAESDTGRGDGA
jgi:hypothetical protein